MEPTAEAKGRNGLHQANKRGRREMVILNRRTIIGFTLTILLMMALADLVTGQSPGSKSTADIIQNLTHKDAKVRSDAAWALGKRGDPSAVGPLIQALDDGDRNVREWASLALAKIGKPAVEPLIAALKDKNGFVKWESAMDLGLINDTRGTLPLISELVCNNSTVRYWAMASLGQIKDPRSLDPLISALGDGNRSLREEAGWAIRSVAGAGSTDLLIRILADGNISRRMGAIDALGNSGDVKAVPPLIGVLEDTDAGVRAGAAESLGRLKDNRSISPLIKHLRDPEVTVRGEAGRALVAIGRPGEEALISALKDGDNTTRAGVAVVLGEIGDERSTEPLLLAFQNSDSNVRHNAVIALARINRSHALLPFVQILQDPGAGSDIRADAAWALGEMNDIKAKGPLLKAMAVDKDENVRLSAAKALKNIGGVSVPVYSI